MSRRLEEGGVNKNALHFVFRGAEEAIIDDDELENNATLKAEGWQAPIRTRARTFGFGPAMVLQAMSRGDLVLPLLFIRKRASIRCLLRRCVVVAP